MAPKKRSGSGASKVKKKKKPSAPAHESDDDGGDDMEEETDGPVPKKVAFGARFMLFRVLMLASAPVSFARGAGNVAKLLSEAAQKGATWARCGSDGRAGLLHHRHFSDSRVHRCGREVGFIRADQSEIDSDPRSRQVYSEFRHEVNQIKSHVQRVQNQSMFERYCLEYHPVRAYSTFLQKCECPGDQPVSFEAPPKDMVFSYVCFLRVGEIVGPPVAGAEIPAPLRKHETIKTYLGAISATCTEFSIPEPPHKSDPDLHEKLKLWKDADEVAQAHPFDFVDDLPKLWAACWTIKSWSKTRALKNWAMFLISICMFARASDVTTHCPLVEDTRLPPEGMWDDDGLPQFVEVCMKDWKSRSRSKKGKPYYMRIWRNYKDARFCPVYWLLTYLKYNNVTSGPIFGMNGKFMAPDVWTNQTDALFKKAGLYTPKHFDQEKQVLVQKWGCTNHSIRRSAAQWAGRCDAREVDVRNAGRWRTMEELAHYMAQGAMLSEKAMEASASGTDPIYDIWAFRPVCIASAGGQDDM
jgi:hypothetical protein